MCGIAGIVDASGRLVDEAVLRRMTDAIAHRGPDGEGHYIDGGLGLGHRRLAIIDLSPAGRQPIANEDGSVWLVYNGEIYNFRELRRDLERHGHRFRSQTDSEVVVHAYEQWGDACLRRFNGMFAFALYDRRESAGPRRLLLARDRYGVKPLYYRAHSAGLEFASEIKAILRHPGVSVQVSSAALGEYFTFQNIFSDLTLFDGIRLLPAGCMLSVDVTAGRSTQTRYWDFELVPDNALGSADVSERLYGLLEQAVSRQLVSDVPVGAYLSGGMDSGSITAVATRQLRRMRTFTAGFDLSSASGLELGFDERPAAEMMANAFKTEHYEMVLHAGDMEQVLPELVWHLEDLRVGQSYPNYYIARLASRFVKVVLSGGGGDELFAGYPWRYYRVLRAGIDDQTYYDGYYNYWQRLVPDQEREDFFTPAIHRCVRDHDPRSAFRQVFADHPPSRGSFEALVNASLYFELKTFLHGLLIMEDKLSMAHSLETRLPFLDNDLVDFALVVPPRLKLRDLEHAPHVDEDEAGKRLRYRSQPTADGKVVLRQAMARLLPGDIVHGSKRGFSAPDASWFAGESIEYVKRLLCGGDPCINAFVNRDYVKRVVGEHSAGRVNHRLLIWSLLSFEWWCRQFLDGTGPHQA